MTRPFHETIIKVAKMLKGAPLYPAEKSTVLSSFKTGQGTAMDRAIDAISEFLHSTPDLTIERARVLDREDGLLTELKNAAEQYEAEPEGN